MYRLARTAKASSSEVNGGTTFARTVESKRTVQKGTGSFHDNYRHLIPFER